MRKQKVRLSVGFPNFATPSELHFEVWEAKDQVSMGDPSNLTGHREDFEKLKHRPILRGCQK